jgi:hypothetical protein
MHASSRVAILTLLAAGVAVAGLWFARRPPPSERAIQIRRDAQEIEFPATVHARAFQDGLFMPGYHAIVWKGGRAGRFALLRAEVSDGSVLRALESLGAEPGNNLPMETWTKRKDPKHPAPDRIATGPPVQILLKVSGHEEPVPLTSVLEDRDGRGIQMRFEGNAANIPKWKSGCIACLYSCPGGKIVNDRYTVRDYERGKARFRVRPGALPADGTTITVVLRLLPQPPPSDLGRNPSSAARR